MTRKQTDGLVLWMRVRSIPQRRSQRVTYAPHVTEVLRQQVRRFTLHRRTGHIPDFLSGIELRSYGRGVRSPG